MVFFPLVKSLDSFIFERVLTSALPIEVLKDARVGIDVNHYLSKVLHPKKEQLVDSVGGFPYSLKSSLESDFTTFKEYNIKPVFVFSGHHIADQFNFKYSKDQNTAEVHRHKQWNLYQSYESQNRRRYNNLPVPSSDNFRELFSNFNYETIFTELISIFHEHSIEYLIAPYFSWAQLIYLYEQDFIDTIYGPNELLLSSSIDKFIVALEPTHQKDFRYVDRVKFLKDFNLTHQQLLDLAVSIGCDLQPVTLPIYQGFPLNKLFDVGLDILTQTGGNLYNALFQTDDKSLLDRFQRGVIAFQSIPVLKTNGKVEISNHDESGSLASTPPVDAHEIIGQRLPHEYYFYESVGLIQPKILEAIVYGKYIEKAPLDGGASQQYKTLLKLVTKNFKNKEINLLTQSMARYYQVKKINYLKWFDDEETPLENKLSISIFNKINSIVVRSDESNFSLKKLLTTLKDLTLGDSLIRIDDDSKKLNKNYEVISTSLLRELFLLEFFTIKDQKIVSNDWSELLSFLAELDEENIEEYLLLLIFFKLNAFKLTEPFNKTELSSAVLLISRLATFIQINQRNVQYTGPISKNLLSFRSAINLIKTSSRELFESIVVSSFTNNEVNKLVKSNEDLRSLVHEFPFQKVTPSTIFGLIVQTIIEEYIEKKEPVQEVKSRVFKHFNDTSNDPFVNISKDFDRFLKFFSDIWQIVNKLNEKKLIDEETFEIFTKSNKIMNDFIL
ncbi:hypothetical protein WICMUC_003137 [Wickerhamomyces mucosus]|uniref:XPG N-terminal domain-containing protein n=1 Tax=Wickerhamomyces mucosus TaxID=1378264 RepID=A0A9P8PM59_9ASCO|nr:hypothetical protein WICMUC_003137 [Wickerhamomyces mucosus]